MKKLILCLVLPIVVASAALAKPSLPRDGEGQKLQSFAPDGTKDETLTANSESRNLTNDLAWGVFTNATTCRFRNSSSATKVGIKHRVATGQWFVRGVNPATPFIHFTSCAGDLQRQ